MVWPWPSRWWWCSRTTFRRHAYLFFYSIQAEGRQPGSESGGPEKGGRKKEDVLKKEETQSAVVLLGVSKIIDGWLCYLR